MCVWSRSVDGGGGIGVIDPCGAYFQLLLYGIRFNFRVIKLRFLVDSWVSHAAIKISPGVGQLIKSPDLL